MELLLLLLGFFGGFVAGLLGLGGAVFMIPLLLYIPPLVTGQSLSAQQTAAISVVYVLAASSSGLLHHLHHKYVNYKIIIFMGGGIFCGAFLGGFISDYLPSKIILAIFGAMTVFATAPIFLSINNRSEVDASSADISFNRLAALLTGLTVGIISGIAGLGAGIILIPVS
ncbi:MAG: sulfite exporter TauE/SafE family protein [Calditrichia bacterium]